jgi:tetratricopeptide (TPR) repeat protein
MAAQKSKYFFFWGITLLIPLLILVLIEVILRVGGYNESKQEVFIDLPGKQEYMISNPNFPVRYFSGFTPQIAPIPFKKEKTDSTYRIVVFGGSSTQGFPYNFYHSFATKLEQQLLLNTNGLHVEVINLGMTAVNSYTIWDLKDHVVPLEPDAVIIYAGHNEYYGSFGIGSAQFGLGNSVGFKRFILRLKDIRIYQFIEHLLAPETEENTGNRTMMARVVSEAVIEKNGEIYRAGIEQFKQNMTEVVEYFSEREISVLIGTVASKLKDQPPLGENEAAISAYKQGLTAWEAGEIEQAEKKFREAKELDEIRFRAPDEINTIIKEYAAIDGVQVLDIEQELAEYALSGINDASLFTDHLHPTAEGHYIIAEAFYKKLIESPKVQERKAESELKAPIAISDFEKAYAATPILRLTAGYPFQKGRSASEEMNAFMSSMRSVMKQSFADSIGASAWRNGRNVAEALSEVINHERRSRDTLSVAQHYLELAYWQVFNEDLIKKGADFASKDTDSHATLATMITTSVNMGNKSAYYLNLLSALYLLNNDLAKAGYWLKESEQLDPKSPELLYNFARFHVMNGDTVQAMDYFSRYSESIR